MKEDKESSLSERIEEVNDLFVRLNGFEPGVIINTQVCEVKEADNLCKIEALKVGHTYKTNCRIAVANTRMYEKDFISVLEGRPNRTYQRYATVAKLIRDALENKADILVLPEAFLPFEWLPTIMRTCAQNGLAIVTGIEHYIAKDGVYNLTAIILPYQTEDFKFTSLSLHRKVHFAPHEKRTIESYGFKCNEGTNYGLYIWNDIWFSVYCCYELAAIRDRSMFMSLADIVIAVEWNKDVNYYSNIIESLSRDLHCYCVQVNTSDYGDSRITKPSKTEIRDMVKLKGGINDLVVIEDVEISKLREFQIKGYALQEKDGSFKPTPPQFNVDIVRKKISRKF